MLDAIAHDGGREFSLSPEFTETGPTILSVRLARWWVAHFSIIVWLQGDLKVPKEKQKSHFLLD
jgi:hypothetical protein